MPDRAILDSSVVTAMFFKEEASPRALKIGNEYKPTTVDVALAETGNVAWKRVVLYKEERTLVQDAFKDCCEFIKSIDLMNSFDLADKAYERLISNFIVEKMAEGYIRLYKKVLR